MGDWFQVMWIYATSILAKVVKIETYRDRSNIMFVGKTVSESYFGTTYTKDSVSLVVETGTPFPTVCVPINKYFWKESINLRNWATRHD